MGSYVYALNTKAKTISGVEVGVAEYRYKPSWNFFDGDKFNAKHERQLVDPRVRSYANRPLPKYFVQGRYEEGANVYECDCVTYLDDSYTYRKVGILVKHGRGFAISFTEQPKAEEVAVNPLINESE